MAEYWYKLPSPSKFQYGALWTDSDNVRFHWLKIGYGSTKIRFSNPNVPGQPATPTTISEIIDYPSGRVYNGLTLSKYVYSEDGVSSLYIILMSTKLETNPENVEFEANFDATDEIPAENLASYFTSFKNFINEELDRRGRSLNTTNDVSIGTKITANHINSFITSLNAFANTDWQVSNATALSTPIGVGQENKYTEVILNIAALSTAPKQGSYKSVETDSTGCQSSCTGLCNTTCSGSCYTGCSTTCTGGCGGNCSGACEGTCRGGCAGSCGTTCNSDCWDQCTSSSAQSGFFTPGCGDCC